MQRSALHDVGPTVIGANGSGTETTSAGTIATTPAGEPLAAIVRSANIREDFFPIRPRHTTFLSLFSHSH